MGPQSSAHFLSVQSCLGFGFVRADCCSARAFLEIVQARQRQSSDKLRWGCLGFCVNWQSTQVVGDSPAWQTDRSEALMRISSGVTLPDFSNSLSRIVIAIAIYVFLKVVLSDLFCRFVSWRAFPNQGQIARARNSNLCFCVNLVDLLSE